MKRCPECRRDYYDDSLLYCRDDGSALLEELSTLEPDTEILPGTGDLAENVITGPQVDRRERSNRSVPSTRRPRTLQRVLGLAVFIFVAAGIGIYYSGLIVPGTIDHFQKVKLSRATNEGNVESAAISPDGKYIAYVTVEGPSSALWTKHLATNSRVKIAAPADALVLYAAGFSPDGNYVYYEVQEQGNPGAGGDLYQIPVLGGPGKKILANVAIANVASPISFDPTGSKIAFGRVDVGSKASSIWIARADGTDEHKLIERRIPDVIWSPSWSPDGQTIAASLYDGKKACEVGFINVDDGTLKPLTSRKFNSIGTVNWLRDGSGLLLVGQDQASEARKIWYIPYPTGEERVVTRDLSNYVEIALTSTKDVNSFLAVQEQRTSSIYLSEIGHLASAQRVSTRTGANDGLWGLSWDKSGRLFSVSEDENKSETWMVDASGSAKMVMEEAAIDSVNVTYDGQHLVFLSRRGGDWEIWRTDISGGDLKQLTNEGGMIMPGLGISPDDRWIFFSRRDGNIRRVSMDGSAPSVLIEAPNTIYPQMSPDGTLLAFEAWDLQDGSQIKIFRVERDTATPFTTLSMPKTFAFTYRWSPDSRSIVYTDTVGRTSNLWELPIDGGKAMQITDFHSEIINNFAFSYDGKRLALARGPVTSDAVLISESK